jgi:creatinine amidohydrolase
MFHRAILAIALLSLTASHANGQSKLSPKWEELTAADFRQGIQQSKGVCVLPFGILEKHGPHLPLGTDLLNVRYASLHAVDQEYAIVFPEYYFGQIFEAKHEPDGMRRPVSSGMRYARNVRRAQGTKKETGDEED